MGAFRPELWLPLRPKERHATKSHRLAKPVSSQLCDFQHTRTWKNEVKSYESIYRSTKYQNLGVKTLGTPRMLCLNLPLSSLCEKIRILFSSPETELFVTLQASGWSTTLFPATLRNPCFSTMEPFRLQSQLQDT